MEAGATKRDTGRTRTSRIKPDDQAETDPPDPSDRKRRRSAKNEGTSEHLSKRLRIQENCQIIGPRSCRRSTRLQERRDSSQRIPQGEALTLSSKTIETRRYLKREQRVGRDTSRALRRSKQRSVLRGNNDRQRSSSLSNLEARKSGLFPSSLPAGDRAINPSAVERSLPSLQSENRKRKRVQAENLLSRVSADPVSKRSRKSLKDSVVKPTLDAEGSHHPGGTKIDLIDYWRREGTWPKEYFEQDDQTRKYFNRDLEEESWLRKYWLPNMEHVLARKKSSSSLRGKQSESGDVALSSTTSDQKPREEKSTPYKEPRYETVLKTKGSFLLTHKEGVTKESKNLCKILLETEMDIPKDSLFNDDLFEDTCEEIRNRNEAKVIQDIARLIVPSARHLAIRGAKQLKNLVESVNEGWNSSIPVTKPRPQPDYSVGFRREVFTDDQLNKLQPFVGEITDTSTSYFMATWYMYFPFLTCEVKCGAASLDIADRQNAHSMTLAARGIVELFRLVKREKELHREILAFSISHDHRAVRIYGHYPVIDGNKATFYRHPIRTFDFTELDGKEKWTAYKFTKNVYDIWMPTHLKRICSVIDELPSDINFELSQQSELKFPEASGLSQELESHHLLQQSNTDSTSLLEELDNQSSLGGSQDMTSNTTPSQRGTFKVPKKRRTAE